MWTWLMILGMTLEHVQMDRKRFWLSESELQSFWNKENHSPFQNQDKLGGSENENLSGKACAQIKHSTKKGQS